MKLDGSSKSNEDFFEDRTNDSFFPIGWKNMQLMLVIHEEIFHNIFVKNYYEIFR